MLQNVSIKITDVYYGILHFELTPNGTKLKEKKNLNELSKTEGCKSQIIRFESQLIFKFSDNV